MLLMDHSYVSHVDNKTFDNIFFSKTLFSFNYPYLLILNVLFYVYTLVIVL